MLVAAGGIKRKRTKLPNGTAKRSRQEEEKFDPIPFPLPAENSNVSCDKDKRIQFPPDQRVHVHLPHTDQTLQDTVQNLFEQHAQTNNLPVVLMFQGPICDDEDDMTAFDCLTRQLGGLYPNSLVTVTNRFEPKTNHRNTTIIEDDNAHLAKLFRALHPVGGGRIAIDCLVFLDSEMHQRGFVPLGTISNQPALLDIVDHTLRYLLWEQHQV